MVNATQVVRSIRLGAAVVEAASDALRRMEGVDAVEVATPRKLRVTYDVTRTGWGALCEQLKSVGAYEPSRLRGRWRDGWREFQEQNMRDNLSHRPACCSKPPAGAGRR